jgi:hypothetical protein
MPFSRCLHLDVNRHSSVYAHIRVQKMLLSICLHYTFQGCPSQYAYIYTLKDEPLSMRILVGVLSLLLYVCIYTYIKVLQKCPNLHAYIWASKDAPLCPYIRVFKDNYLYMPKLSIPNMPLSICPRGSKKIPLSLCQYPDLKNCFSTHAYIMVSKIAPSSMLIFGSLKMTPV